MGDNVGLVRYENTTNFSGKEVTSFTSFVTRPIFIKLAVALFVLFVGMGFYMFFVMDALVTAIIMWSLGVVSVAVMPFTYKHTVLKGVRNNTMCSSSTYMNYKFEDGGVKISTRKGDVEVAMLALDYRHIVKILQVQHYLFIFVTDTQAYILDVNGMTSGKANNLIDFLKSKHIKYVNKNKESLGGK